MLIFGATINCIPWVYVPEILPLRVRAKGTAVGVSAMWTFNFFVVMVAPTLMDNLAWRGYLIFVCLNAVFIPLVYFCYPETSNLSLEAIDGLFLGENAVRKSRQVAKHGWGHEAGWTRARDHREDGVTFEQEAIHVGKGSRESPAREI